MVLKKVRKSVRKILPLRGAFKLDFDIFMRAVTRAFYECYQILFFMREV